MVKDEAEKLIDQLSKEATWVDITHEIYVRSK